MSKTKLIDNLFHPKEHPIDVQERPITSYVKKHQALKKNQIFTSKNKIKKSWKFG